MVGFRSRSALLIALSLCVVVSSHIRAASLVPDAAWEEPLAIGLPNPSANFAGMTSPPAGFAGPQTFVAPTQYALPQPQAMPENIAPPAPVNGIWRDEGQYVIIEVNGQQLRLLKSALAQQQPASAAGQIQIPTGSVHGRLLQRGQPLVNCQVVIVPMHKDGATDENGIRQPVTAVTDAEGVFGFENVPVGSYKLTWLPAGATQWIRRIEMKPDVVVREGQDTTLREIRTALRTIN